MAHLREYLEEQSFKESRVCHSTGTIIVEEATRVQDDPLICRGSRNVQLRFLCGVGFLAEPTDEEWNRKFQEINTKEEVTHGEDKNRIKRIKKHPGHGARRGGRSCAGTPGVGVTAQAAEEKEKETNCAENHQKEGFAQKERR